MSESVLLLDAGNTRLKWAIKHGDSLRDHGAFAYENSTDLGLPETLTRAFSAAGTSGGPETATELPSRALIGSVASADVNRILDGWLRDNEIRAQHVSVRILDRLTPAYRNPGKLGVDRWLAMLGAQSMYPGTVCVADCGTALTLDSVDRNGMHLGGMILPGFDLMQRALLTQTARIDEADQPLPKSLFGTSTGAAVNAGATCALAATLDRFVAETTRELGSDPVVFVTGGGRERLLRYAESDVIEVPDLVLLGLASLDHSGS